MAGVARIISGNISGFFKYKNISKFAVDIHLEKIFLIKKKCFDPILIFFMIFFKENLNITLNEYLLIKNFNFFVQTNKNS